MLGLILALAIWRPGDSRSRQAFWTPAAAVLAVLVALIFLSWVWEACVVNGDRLVVRSFWDTYRVPADAVTAVQCTPRRSTGRWSTWAWVLVSFTGSDGMPRRVVVACTSKAAAALERATSLWNALPAATRARVPAPVLDRSVWPKANTPVRVRRRRLRREFQRLRDVEPAELTGVLLGPGIPSVIGNCTIEFRVGSFVQREGSSEAARPGRYRCRRRVMSNSAARSLRTLPADTLHDAEPTAT